MIKMITNKCNQIWYKQCQIWLNKPPEMLSITVKKAFVEAVELFLQCCDNGYNIPDNYNKQYVLNRIMLMRDEISKIRKRNGNYYISPQFETLIGFIVNNSGS